MRKDIKVLSFAVNTLFIYNYKKYSLRGAFSFTDVQRKSAGSFMTGFYHSHVLFSASDSAFVNTPFRNYFSTSIQKIAEISVITIGVSAGYGYTHVYKKIIASAVVNFGSGIQKINYTSIDGFGHTLSIHPSANMNAKAALRYDNLRFFMGMMTMYDNNFSFNSKLFSTQNYMGRILLFGGYRFDVRKKSRKIGKALHLIEYN